MRRRQLALTGCLLLTAAAAVGAHPGVAAGATRHFPLHPGAAVRIAGNHCEVGTFLRHGHTVYAVVPASCLGTDSGTGGNGCMEAQVPGGSTAAIAGARHKAYLVYSSFSEMQLRGKSHGNACSHNNLALLRLDHRDVHRVTPTIPGIGRPSATAKTAPAQGASLHAFVGGSERSATAGSTSDGGWRHDVTIDGTVSAADLGSPVVAPGRRFVGMATVVPGTPVVGSTQVADFHRELHFLHKTRGFHHVHVLTQPV